MVAKGLGEDVAEFAVAKPWIWRRPCMGGGMLSARWRGIEGVKNPGAVFMFISSPLNEKEESAIDMSLVDKLNMLPTTEEEFEPEEMSYIC